MFLTNFLVLPLYYYFLYIHCIKIIIFCLDYLRNNYYPYHSYLDKTILGGGGWENIINH